MVEFARDLIETHSDGLAKVHGDVLIAGRDVQEPVTVAEVVVGEAGFLRTEEQGDASGLEVPLDQRSDVVQRMKGLL